MQYFSMTLLLILICMSLRFSGAFPVFYRSLKHTDHAERYGVSILPTYFTSKFTTLFAIENDETNFDGSNYKTSCVSCENSSVVPEETNMDQEAGSLIHSGYTITTQDNLNSAKLNTSIDMMGTNTTPMNAIFSSELSSSQNDEYIHIWPAGMEERSMTEVQSSSEVYYNVEQEREKSDIYSTLQYTVSGYIGAFTVGYGSTVEHETFEDKTTVIQLEGPTKIDQTTEYQYHSVPSKNLEHSLGTESVTSGYLSTPTYSNDTELHTSFQIVTQHSPRTNYTTGSTSVKIERNGHIPIAPNRGIIGLKHETFSTPQLTHQGIQTTTLESFTFENSSNEIKNKNFETPEYEEKKSVLSHGDKIKVTYSKKNGNIIGTTQQVKSNDSLMLASIISTPAQLDSNAVTVNTENYERTYSNRKQLPTAVATKEQTYHPSSLHKHVNESFTRFTDTSFETRAIATKEGYRREYKESSTDTSKNLIQTVEQNKNWRKMEMIGPTYFTLVDRDQLKDVEYLETTEFENELDIEMIDVYTNKNDNSEERVQVGMSNDNARMPMSQELQITGGQNNNTDLSYEYASRTGTNLQQRFTSGSSLGQSNEDLEIQERWKKPDHSGEYYLDEEKKPEDIEFLTTAPLFHTNVQRPLNSLVTNERAREELHVGRLQNETQAHNTQEEDIENFEIIEREEELDLAITTISPISHSRERKVKLDNVATAQRRMESMRVANNRHDELNRNENGDLRRNSAMELERKEKPHKHFKTQELDDRTELGNLKSKFWSKGGGSNNRGETSTKTSDSGAVTSSTFVKIMKIKKQKSTVSSGQREEKNNTDSKKNYKHYSRIMLINETELVSNFTKVKKEKKQKHNIPTEKQRNMYQKKNVRNNEFHGVVSNFTKRMKVRVMKNALQDKLREESPLSERVGRCKIDKNRIQEQTPVTIFIKKRKDRKPKQILSIKGRDDADKTGSMLKLKLSKKLEDQHRQLSAAPISNFTKKPRCKKQKHTFTYSGREEACRTEEPRNLEPHKNNHSSEWEFSRNVSGKNEKYEGLEILDNDLSILKSSKLEVGKLKEGNGNVEGNINARPFHFQRKDMKIVAKNNVSTNEKTKEGERKAALMLNLNQQKSRNEGMTEDSKKQSEKVSSHLRNTKKPEPTMDILFRITKKNKFPRFALDLGKTTMFAKRKKLAKIRQQKKTTLFIPITVPYQKSFFNTQDQYWQEKSVTLYLPTITSYHTGFPDNQQRKKLFRYPLKLPTLYTVSEAKEYMTNVANNDSNRFRKRPKFTESGVTKPMSLWFMVRKEHKLNKERNESTGLVLTELPPRLFTNKQTWNRKNERPEKPTGLFIPTTTSYQSTLLEKEKRKYLSRYPLKLPVPTLFTKLKARGYTDAVPNTYQSRFLETPKGMLSTKFAVTKPVPMWFTRRKGFKLGMEQPEGTSLHYPITVADEPKFFKLPNRTDNTALLPTIPFPVAFTKRKKPKLKVTNTTVFLNPITIFHQNKFDSFADGNEPPKTATSHPQKVPNRTDNTAVVPTIPFPVAFTKRKKPKLKVTNTTVSLSPITIFRQNKFDSIPDRNEPPQTAITSHLPRMFTKLQHGVFKKLPVKTVAPFNPTTKSYVIKFHEMSPQNKKYRPAIVLPLFKKRIGQGRTYEMTTQTTELVYPGTYASQPQDSRTKQPYGQESTNEMTTQVTELFYPLTNAYQGKQQVTQTKRKQTVGDVTMPVFSFFTKWKEMDIKRKWPLKTSTRATYSDETTFGKTPKQDRRTKLPVTKAHWMFRQFPVKIPNSTVNPTTMNNMTTSERQDSERPPESTCLATSNGDQESTCPAWRSTPIQTTYSTSDGITDYIDDEISSSIQTSDTSSTTEWFTLDSYSESLSTEETTTDTGESDEQLTSLSDGKELGTSPIIWKATMGPRNELLLEHTSLTSILSSHVTRDDNSIAEDTTIETNPPSAIVSSADEETDIYSTTLRMKAFSFSTTQYSTNLQDSTALNEDFYTDSSSTTDYYTDYESSVSNFPRSATEPSSVSTSDTEITQESTTLNEDFHTDSTSTTDSHYEPSISNFPQSATDPSSLSTSDTEITQESPALNEDFHTDSSSTAHNYTDYESSVSNFPQSVTEPSSLATSDTEITQETTTLNEDIHTHSSSTTDNYTDYESSVSNFPQSATEPSSLSTSDTEITQESTTLNEDFHTDSTSTPDSYTDYESSVSNFPQSVTEPSSLSTSDSEITDESTALNEDFHTDSTSTPDSYTDYESSVSNFPQSATEPSSISTSDSEITHESTALNEDFHTDSPSTTTFNTDIELSISNVPHFTSEPVYTRTDGLSFVTSINTSPISDSNTISTSSFTSPFSTPITSGITSHAQHEEYTEAEEDILQQSVTDGSNTTVSYFGTEVANTNVSQSVSSNLHVGTDDLILSSSTHTSTISNLLPSPGETISSSASPLTTPLTHEITSSTSSGADLLSLDGVQQDSDSSRPGLTVLHGDSKSSTSFISHFVDQNVTGTSTTMRLGSISRTAPTHSSSSTAATEITKRRTCRRLVKTSPVDSASCALPTPFLTLRPTSRRRLKSSTRPTA